MTPRQARTTRQAAYRKALADGRVVKTFGTTFTTYPTVDDAVAAHQQALTSGVPAVRLTVSQAEQDATAARNARTKNGWIKE